jgi:hypothetical protein
MGVQVAEMPPLERCPLGQGSQAFVAAFHRSDIVQGEQL